MVHCVRLLSASFLLTGQRSGENSQTSQNVPKLSSQKLLSSEIFKFFNNGVGCLLVVNVLILLECFNEL